MGSRGTLPPCGVKRRSLLWGQGAKPLEGSAGNHNSIQTRRCAHKSKGTALSVSVCNYRDNYSQRRPAPSVARTFRNSEDANASEVIPSGCLHSKRYRRLRTRRGSGAIGKPPRQGGRLSFDLHKAWSVKLRTASMLGAARNSLGCFAPCYSCACGRRTELSALRLSVPEV